MPIPRALLLASSAPLLCAACDPEPAPREAPASAAAPVAAATPPEPTPAPTTTDPTPVAARSAALVARVQAMNDAHTSRLLAAMERNEPPPTQPEGWPALRSELAAIARDDPDRGLRNLATILYFERRPESDPGTLALATAGLRDIAPTNPLWSTSPSAFRRMLDVVPDPAAWQATIDILIDHHPDPTIGGEYLLYRLEKLDAAGDPVGARPFYDRLQLPRFAATDAQMLSQAHAPGRPLQPGKSMPVLDLELLAAPGAPAQKLNLERYRGRPLLIDVWATWCKPCIAEMPELHALYEHHGRGKDGLQILGIAMNSPASVQKFRRGKWPMPWHHATVPDDRHDAFEAQLGIVGIPATILLDAHGTIVAATPNLELADIPKHLAALTPPSAAVTDKPSLSPSSTP